MTRPILKDSTDQSTVIRIVDSTDGTPETSVTSATSGLDLKYRREGAAVSSLTESDLSALTDSHADGGLLHIGAGYYRLDLPDAAVATGANGVLVFGSCTGMVVIGSYHPLVDYNPYDGVRMGMTALPNAAAAASGGLFIRGTGAGAINQDANGRIDVNVEAWNTTAVPAEHTSGYPIVTVKDGTGTGEIDTTSGKVAITDGAISSTTLATGAITADSIASAAITSAKFGAGAITATVIATDAIDADALAADAVTEIGAGVSIPAASAIADAVWDESTSGHTTSGTFGAQLKTQLDLAVAYGAPPTAVAVADAVLARAVSNVEGTADKHSLGAIVMIGTNSSLSGTTLTAKKPSDDSTFFTYTVTTSSSADPITSVA